MKTVLFVGGGVETVPAVQLARGRGLRTVVSDRDPQAPALLAADAALVADTYDGEATLAAVQASGETIDGVLCVACDVPATVAQVAAACGLPGIPLAAAEMAMDKLAMKECFAAQGIPVPWFRQVTSAAELQQCRGEHAGLLVIKPVDSRGARGVQRLLPAVDSATAFQEALRHSPSGRVMVERYLPGPQVSSESLIVDGQAFTPGISDRNYELLDRFAPFMIENGGDLPGICSDEQRDAINALIQHVADVMGIRNGVIKGDIVLVDGLPVIIEVATRLSGGYFCSHEIPLNTGVDFVWHAIRLCLGEQPSASDCTPQYLRPICQRYIFPPMGTVRAIHGTEQLATMPGIEFVDMRVQVGQDIGRVNCHPSRGGVLIASGDTPQQAREHAEAAVAAVRIEVDALPDAQQSGAVA